VTPAIAHNPATDLTTSNLQIRINPFGSIRSTLKVTPAIAHNPATDLATSNPANPQWKMKMSQSVHTTPPILTKPWHSGTPIPPFHPDVADLCTKSAPKTPLLHTTAKHNAHPQ